MATTQDFVYPVVNSSSSLIICAMSQMRQKSTKSNLYFIITATPHEGYFLYFQDSNQWKQTRAKSTNLRVINTWWLRKQLRCLREKCVPATVQWLEHSSLSSPWNPHLRGEVPTSSLPTYCQRLPGSSFQRISQHWLSYPPLYSARKAPEGLHSSAGISAESYNKSFPFCVSAFCLFC